MKILLFTSLLLASIDVENNNDHKKEAEIPKIVMDFYGKQFKINEGDATIVNEMFKKFSTAPSDILDISKNLDNIKSNPEEELRRGERFFAIYFVDEATALAGADHKDDSITVFISTDEKLAESMGVPFPGVYGFNPIDKISYKVSLKGMTSRNINAILKTPMIGPISYENFGMYRATELPLLYLFTKVEEIETVKNSVLEQVRKCRNFGKFVIIPFDETRITPEVFGFSAKDLPALVFIKERAKYNLLKANTQDFESFIVNALEGKIEPFYASEKEPENNKQLDVKVITRDNLTGFLEDSSKDRLLVFSSPDCGYRKTLKPILEEFGKIVTEHANDKVFVGSCDVTVNDITDFDVAAVPAIFLIKAESNERVKLEGGDRTLENLAKFVREKGHHSVDLTSAIPAKKEEVVEEDEGYGDELPIEEPVSEKFSEREEV